MSRPRPLRTGELDQYVTIQQGTEGQDTTGEPDMTWATLASIWAMIEPLRGNELLGAQKVSATANFGVRIRARSDVTAKMRIIWGTRTLDIEQVMPSTRREHYLDLICAERT